MKRFLISGAFLVALVALALLACGDDETGPVNGGPTDTTAPGVDSVAAVDNQHVAVYYNEAVEKTSVEYLSNYTITEAAVPFSEMSPSAPGDTLLLHSVSLGSDGKTALITTSDPMSNVPYSVEVCCIKDVSGNQMAAPVTQSFTGTSAGDLTPPSIVYREPAPGATGVNTAQAVVVQFSEMVIGYSVFDGFTWSGGGGDVLWDMETQDEVTFVFTPQMPLGLNTLYTVTLTGVADYSANPMATVSWTFRTRSQPDNFPPTLVSSSPSNGQTNVSVNTNLVMTFSEAMDQYHFQAQLTPSVGDGIALWSNGGRTITFDPDLPLQDDTQYYLLILPGDARDLAGNGIAAPVSIRFSTGASFESGSFAGRVSGDPGTQADNPAGAIVIAPNVLPFDVDQFELFGSAIVSPGAGQNYSITALPDGVYYPVSAMDTNGDSNIDPDMGDAIGAYGFDFRAMPPDMSPDSVTISGGNTVTGVDFPLFDQMAITGTFSYDGTAYTSGDYLVYIGAFDVNGFVMPPVTDPVFGTQEWWPYNVEFMMNEMNTLGFAAGDYYIGAFMDVNYNDTYDPGTDPAGFYGGLASPTEVNIADGSDANGLHISLVDPAPPFTGTPVVWGSSKKEPPEWYQRLSSVIRRAVEESKAPTH